MRYSPDLRKRVLDFIAAGGSKAEASRRFQVSGSSIYNWLDVVYPFAYKKPGPRKPYRLDPAVLAEHVKEFPDSTQKERVAHFGVSQRCICYGPEADRMHGKKDIYLQRTMPSQTGGLSHQLQTALVNGKTPVFVDESGFSTESVRQFAYTPRGACVSDKISSNRYRSTTLIAAQIQGRFTTPVLFEGACDALAFNAWLENVLCPLLDASHVVILDNASFHKSQQTEALIAACGASLLF